VLTFFSGKANNKKAAVHIIMFSAAAGAAAAAGGGGGGNGCGGGGGGQMNSKRGRRCADWEFDAGDLVTWIWIYSEDCKVWYLYLGTRGVPPALLKESVEGR